MSYRSYEQTSTPSTTAGPISTSPSATAPSYQRRKALSPGAIFLSSQLFKRNRYLLPFGALSAAVAMGLSVYARTNEPFFKIPYRLPFSSSDHPPVRNSFLKDAEMKRVFYCGNSQHMYNSLAIMASPFTSPRPLLTSSLLFAGISLFCGTQYYRVIKEEPELARPVLIIGGLCLLTGWLTFIL